MSINSLTVAMVAGETSGDSLGAGLIHELKLRYHRLRVVGIAGPCMRLQGCEAWYQIEDLSVMGLVEVLGKILPILKILRDVRRRIIALKPDVFIGIDFPDFNILLEGYVKRAGIRTIHYVSPSVWAWRQQRIFKIGRNTHLILALFPFEKDLYEKFNIPCCYVGHPIADIIPLQSNKLEIRRKLALSEEAIYITLLPGSRTFELKMQSAIFLQAAQLLHQRYPELKILVALLNAKHCMQFKQIKAQILPDLPIQIFEGNSREVMIASDSAIVTSGTATLECMLAKCPMVVGYRLNPISFWFIKRLIKISYISLPNLLAGREIVKELLQHNCKPEALAYSIEPFLSPGLQRNIMINTLNILHKKISCNANKLAADAVTKLVTNDKFI